VIIALDIDGVVADLHSEWYRRYNEEYHDNLTRERVVTWNTHLYVKPECGKRIYDYLLDDDLYRSVQPIRGAAGGVAALRRLGHTVFFTTACGYAGGTMVDQKGEWLIRHGLVEKTYRRVPIEMVVVEDKCLVDADLLIDDRGETVAQWVNQKRRPAILFEYPHNQYLLDQQPSAFWSVCHRARDWREIIKIMEARAA